MQSITKARSAFVERGLAVQIASTELALVVNGTFTGQENMLRVFCLGQTETCRFSCPVNAPLTPRASLADAI